MLVTVLREVEKEQKQTRCRPTIRASDKNHNALRTSTINNKIGIQKRPMFRVDIRLLFLK